MLHFPDGLPWSEGWVVAVLVGVRVTNLDIVITCLPCYGEYTLGVDSGQGWGRRRPQHHAMMWPWPNIYPELQIKIRYRYKSPFLCEIVLNTCPKYWQLQQ